jgi:hypothetical protein
VHALPSIMTALYRSQHVLRLAQLFCLESAEADGERGTLNLFQNFSFFHANTERPASVIRDGLLLLIPNYSQAGRRRRWRRRFFNTGRGGGSVAPWSGERRQRLARAAAGSGQGSCTPTRYLGIFTSFFALLSASYFATIKESS